MIGDEYIHYAYSTETPDNSLKIIFRQYDLACDTQLIIVNVLERKLNY